MFRTRLKEETQRTRDTEESLYSELDHWESKSLQQVCLQDHKTSRHLVVKVKITKDV